MSEDRRLRVGIVGAGFSGAILARQLCLDGSFNVTIFEQSEKNELCNHWTQPLSGAALNVNANGMASMREFDSVLYDTIREISYPRKHMRAVSVDKTVGQLFEIPDLVAAGMADCHGALCRWDDANRTIRDLLPEEVVVWGRSVTSFSVNDVDGTVSLLTTNTNAKNCDSSPQTYGPFDLVVAADGRYSSIRQQIEQKKTADVVYEEVCNFRILVPDLGTVKLPDDLTLLYNLPDSEKYPEYASSVAFQGLARVGMAKCPPTKLLAEGSVYIFGNFSVPLSTTLPDYMKSADFLTALFTPSGGEESLTEEGKFLIQTLRQEVDRLHWARFQHIQPLFHQPINLPGQADIPPILLLGDAAHAFCPALGQGATSAIEDAFAAAQIIKAHYHRYFGPGAENGSNSPSSSADTGPQRSYTSVAKEAILAFSAARMDRIEKVKDLSISAGEHILPGNRTARLAKEIEDWSNLQGPWMQRMRELWTNYPKRDAHF